jgi:hypothetical protein
MPVSSLTIRDTVDSSFPIAFAIAAFFAFATRRKSSCASFRPGGIKLRGCFSGSSDAVPIAGLVCCFPQALEVPIGRA